MKEVFINEGITNCFKTFLNSQESPESIKYNTFLSVIIRLLILIYGQDIINSYQTANEEEFTNILSRYNISTNQIKTLYNEIQSYYSIYKDSPNSPNPYFKYILEILIDMFIAKKTNTIVKYDEEEKFLDLAYTTSTKNAFRISYLYLIGESPLYFEKYYYTKINNFEVTKEYNLSKTMINELTSLNVNPKPSYSTAGFVNILVLMSVIVLKYGLYRYCYFIIERIKAIYANYY